MFKRLCVFLGEEKWYNMFIKIEDIVIKEKGFLLNVDFYLVFVYYCLGIDYDLFIFIFVISCMLGWLVYILE